MPNPTRAGHALARLAPILVVALLVAACGGGSSGGIKVSDAWSRTSPMVAGAGAAYMTIENGGSAADRLLGGSSDIAKAVEVHETYKLDSVPEASAMPGASGGMGAGASPMASGGASPMASPGGMGDSGMMGMRKIDSLEIPAGGMVKLMPGGYHIMLIGLTRELVVGEKIEMTLKFEKAGDVKVTAEVRGQ
jgi:periplasmic copper chaperone A